MSWDRWILERGDELQVELFFGLLLVLAALEVFWPRRAGRQERRVRWPANLLLTLLNFLVLSVMPVTLIGAALFAERTDLGLLHRVAAPFAVVALVTLLARAFISFSSHWLMHKVPWFWRVHRVHHLDTELDVTTTVRFHPLEFVLQALPAIPVVLLLGLDPAVLMLYELLDVAVTLWTHSNLRLPAKLDRVLRRLVVTPDLHRIHHSSWQPETDSNFGAVFPVWDLVFGTYREVPRDGHEHMRLGLDEVRGPAAHHPLWLLTSVARRDLAPPAPAAPQSSVEPTQARGEVRP